LFKSKHVSIVGGLPLLIIVVVGACWWPNKLLYLRYWRLRSRLRKKEEKKHYRLAS
jgi:hypothetical protein